MKLKNLKDLDFVDCGKFASNSLIKYKIKAEAIKWVKWKLSKNPNLKIEKITWSGGKVLINWKGDKDFFTAGFCNSLIEFNNITEEELKK